MILRGEVILSRERPTTRSGSITRGAALSAILAILTVTGCSSTTELSDDTLPPLAGAPTTLALPGVTSSSMPGSESTVAQAPNTDPSATSTSTSATTPSAAGAWGGWAYYEVPQLGTEPVRGSGCGANGGLGDVVPDGVWNVNIGDGAGGDQFWSGGQMSLDMRCIYAGDAGRAQWNTVCSGAPQSNACQSQSPDWFVVNSNRRLRTMPVASNVAYGVGALGTTPCAGVSLDPTIEAAPWRSMDNWVVVSGGVVTTVISACPAG